MRMWRKPLVTAYQSRAFRKRHAVPFSAAFQQPAARLCDPGSNGPPSAYNEPKRPGPQAGGATAKQLAARIGAGGHRGRRRIRAGPSPSGAIRENRKTSGKGKPAMDVDRKHVLIACAIAGAVLGLVLAVLQAAGAFPTSDLHGMPTGASRTTGFMLAMAPLLAAWGFTIHLRCSDALIARYLKSKRRPVHRLAAHRHAEIPYRQRPPGLHHVVPLLCAHAADQHVQPVQRHARLSPRPHARHKLRETGRIGHRCSAHRAGADEQPASRGVSLLVRRPAVVGQLHVRPGVLGGARLDHHADRAVLRLLVRRCAQAVAQRVRAHGPYRWRAGDVHGALHPAVPDRLQPCARVQHSADLLSRDSA